jgi:hypothetical protein
MEDAIYLKTAREAIATGTMKEGFAVFAFRGPNQTTVNNSVDTVVLSFFDVTGRQYFVKYVPDVKRERVVILPSAPLSFGKPDKRKK